MKKRVTLAEVAKEAGVSLSTTSRVLNQSDKNMPIKISQRTRQRVKKAADKLGYSTNLAASFMRKSSTKIIGIIIRDINDPFLAKLATKVEEDLIAQGFSVLIGNTNRKSSLVSSQIKFMITNFFDGIIIIDNVPPESDLINVLNRNETPYVAVTGSFDKQITPVVRTDDYDGLKKLIEYLYQLNHRQIAFIGRNQRGAAHRERMVKELFNEFGLSINDQWFVREGNTPQLEQLIKELFKGPVKPTAIICAEDVLAIKVIKSLRKADLKVPDDVSVTGFDGLFQNSYDLVNVTSVVQPIDKLAKWSATLLLRKIKTGELDASLIKEIKPWIFKGSTVRRI